MEPGMKRDRMTNKMDYMKKLTTLMEEYPRFILVTCDNIGSHHLQKIRTNLRDVGLLLMGKNTLMRKAIRLCQEDHPEWQEIIPRIKGNIGFFFTKEEFLTVQPKLMDFRVPVAAKIGMIAPEDFFLPSQITSLDPAKTNFFAALGIGSKISRGCIEILAKVKICSAGRRIGSSEAALLQMLEMRPFTYGVKIVAYFEAGYCFTDFGAHTFTNIHDSLATGIRNIAALSLAVGYPTLPAFPYVIGAGFKNVLAVALATGHECKQAASFQSRAPVALAEVASTPAALVAAETQHFPAKEKDTSTDEGNPLLDFF